MKLKKIEETLQARGGHYGPYLHGIKCRTEIIEILKRHNRISGLKEMSPEFVIAIGDIVGKLVRCAAYPVYADNFHDIAGYATLIEKDMCDKDEE